MIMCGEEFMIVSNYRTNWIGGAVAGMLFASAPLLADSSVSFSGMIRQEMAYNIGDENPYNQHGNVYNNKPSQTFFGDFRTRPDLSQDNDWNLMATRIEIDMNAQLSNDWTAFVRLRGFFDNNIYKDFEDPNHFEAEFWGDCGGALEICDENYMVDLPAAYLDYSHGPFWVRIGNQQVALGEAIFFRVLDVANGLDLRRHSFLDWASEEYADERVAAPAVRGSMRFAEAWELEGFVQLFSPTIYSGENTPYNLVTAQFALDSSSGFDDVRGDLTTGLRLKGQLTDELHVQFIAINRRNPDGVISWKESGINPFVGSTDPTQQFLGPLLAQQPFEAFTGQGVVTAAEFHTYGSMMYVDPTSLVHTAINDFPALTTLVNVLGGGALPTNIDTRDKASLILDAFMAPPAQGGLGNLRGHIQRTYPWENVFGFGMNYMVNAEQGTFLDQLMLRFEATFTPDKKFTNSTMTIDHIEADEFAASFVVEKYHRFSDAFPATYMVFEWLHKSESDMLGRHLSGYGSTHTTRTKGRADFDAIAFALQQPSKTLMWRFDLAILYDVKGGHFIQPGVRYKPNGSWTVEGYGNFFDGSSKDMMSAFEWADEIGVRIGYQF